ncbi:hypothetical protein HBHAL_1884 [Halobacillus halophilus DSM 2266]|uniref:Uncharacterized protein n=1 Tax=Halobacillus halophilus (strain ATCC 35676 / DSM 2266 / JCM 20832 / KCTC 3685 / LMG 17431 / NBRC 102448 / NCIMB 2269) TaxID=866895 RepID=I0JJC8_HALH3|nr:hypothetical protein [Halobacillus halophilus]CCG44246.1 hypothetical protein HBHAL_1884 [Halobacillus halophilus DSM 2266]
MRTTDIAGKLTESKKQLAGFNPSITGVNDSLLCLKVHHKRITRGA